jgi:hypothetical protein
MDTDEHGWGADLEPNFDANSANLRELNVSGIRVN